MKVAFVTHWLSRAAGGGIATAVESLSRVLVEQGTETIVLGLRDQAWDEQRYDWSGAPARACSVIFPRAAGISPKLRQELVSADPHVVHTHGLWMHTSADVSSWSRGSKPYIVSPHGMLDRWALRNSQFKKRVARILYEDRHLFGARCVHALTDTEAGAIRELGYGGRIRVIPNGVELPPETAQPPPPWAGDLPKGSRVLLYLGRLHPKKNLLGLLQAFTLMRVAEGFSEWVLVIAGPSEGSHGAILEAAIRELELERHVHLVGPLYGPCKDAAFRNAEAFVLPSLSEGLPMAVLEAWAHRLPVAMSEECNLPLGFSADAAHPIGTDPNEMASDLATFLRSSRADLRKMGLRGHAVVARHFSWEAVAAEFREVYNSVYGG